MSSENEYKEVGCLFDFLDGSSFFVIGEANRVNIGKNVEIKRKLKENMKKSLIFIHNHPTSLTFSQKDFKSFCLSDTIKSMIIVGHNGNIYILSKKEAFNSFDFSLRYKELINEECKQLSEPLFELKFKQLGCSKRFLLHNILEKEILNLEYTIIRD